MINSITKNIHVDVEEKSEGRDSRWVVSNLYRLAPVIALILIVAKDTKDNRATPLNVRPIATPNFLLLIDSSLRMRVQRDPSDEHRYPDSTWQEEEHPSLESWFESSPFSELCILPSPRKVQLNPCVGQAYPGSFLQEEQSPSETWFLSSHCSLPFTRPSLQVLQSEQCKLS